MGNWPGDKAPDFSLKDEQGNEVSLRDFLGKEIRLEFVEGGKIHLEGKTLLDAEGTVRRLYAVATLPHTVTINSDGIIK